jgi:3-methyladenine DNA glycosylase AlkD
MASANTLPISAKAALAMLKAKATKRTRDGMARYGLPSDNALGVSVGDIQKIAKQIGPDHELALALWKTGVYEARMLTSFIDEPERVTPKQMDAWCDDFDNWGIVDTVCFKLFDRSPHAYAKARQWVKRRDEFGKRAGFVLYACLAGHDKTTGDKPFLDALKYIERGAADERNFVKKGVLWALRRIGGRSATLRKAAKELGARLANSESQSARWIGRSALKELK